MLLALDVGNTRTHVGLFRAERLVRDWHTATDGRATADDLASTVARLVSAENLRPGVAGVAIASVVPALTERWRRALKRVFRVRTIVIGPGIDLGIAVAVDRPSDVGADRLANAIAAHHLVPGRNAIVVDMGTATKVDAVSVDGRFIGGAVAPGITPAFTELTTRAAALACAPPRAAGAAIGTQTARALESGAVLGAAAMADALVERVRSEVGGRPRVVATGGAASIAAPHSAEIDWVEPALTLLGVRLVLERDRARWT